MKRGLIAIVLMALVGCSSAASPSPTPAPLLSASPQPTQAEAAPASPSPTPAPPPSSASPQPTQVETAPASSAGDPFDLISQESLFAFMEDLTAIQPYSGWRNSATQGETEALDYVAERLGEFEYLGELGLDLERQSFRVFMGTELWETRLHLTVDGEEIEVPADGLRGHRDGIGLALRFDSDGVLNDADRDPVVVEGSVVLVGSSQEIDSLSPSDVEGSVVFVDYAVIDRVLLGKERAQQIASKLLDMGPAGLVLVTHFSNQVGESHGAFVGDVGALTEVESSPAPPTLYVRLEDLAPAGIESWDDMAQVQTARLAWDADVFSPANSGNLVARIPGADSSQAVILSAHIDSPNSPGAMDDGSGSVILLEMARVLNAAQVQPAVDLYLVWFGSEELWLYGSYHFAATHQELLDRTLATLQIDMLARPLEGINAELNLVTWSYGRLGDDRLAWPDYLSQAAERRGVETVPLNSYHVYSDNNALGSFDVPHADLCYTDERSMYQVGGVHYASHIHDPYDTVDLAREVGDVLEEMARVALAAALDTAQEAPDLRVTPPPDRRALFVASHTESVHMTPGTFTDLGMALAWEGFDVDLIPYGQAVTSIDLDGADLVVVLPVLDYPSPEGGPDPYDEAWSQEEIAALEAYVAEGGLLVLTNSAHRLKTGNLVLDPNEDWSDANALAERFGVSYESGRLTGTEARTEGEHPLVEGISTLELAEANGVPFSLVEGEVLAWADSEFAACLVDYGQSGGEVLVLADVGMLSAGGERPINLPFWRNLARYARSH